MRHKPAFATTAPVAVIGTIALSLTAAPAHAGATTERDAPGSMIPSLTARDAAAARTAAVLAAAQEYAAARKRATHTVVRGDTISGIAARHGLRTADVLAWNDLGWKSIIHPGDVIRLSASSTAATAQRTSKTSAAPTSSGSASSSGTRTHTVVRGDTLWTIAQRSGISLARLLRANDLTSASIIYPGEKLRIPGAGTSASADTATSSSKKSRSDGGKKAAASSATVSLDAEQIRGVKTIIAIGRDLGVPKKGIAIALATAMVESWIRNVDYGTHDSLGLFQQRPSMGWGTAEQVQDPHHATRAFFGGDSDPNGTATRGLLDIDGWRDMEFGAAAQAVQVSAFPHRYGQWEEQAYAWIEAYG